MSAVKGDRIVATARTRDHEVLVLDTSLYRELVFVKGRASQSQTRIAHGSLQSDWPCVDGFHLAPLVVAPARVLFVGCGGGLGVRQFARAYPDARIDVVEIDAAVVKLAEAWFGLVQGDRVNVTIGDGRAFLEGCEGAYDVVVSDVWAAGVLPVPFVSIEYFRALHRVLAVGGAIVCNLGGVPGDRDDALHRFAAGARAAFGDEGVRLLPVPEQGELPTEIALDLPRNVLLLARRDRPLPSDDELRRRAHAVTTPWLVHLPRIADAAPIAPIDGLLPLHDDEAPTIRVV